MGCIIDPSKRIGMYRQKRPHSVINSMPWEIMTADTVELDNWIVEQTCGERYLLTIVEYFSKFAYVFPLQEKTAKIVK
jgi:hypothetical protein